jgi:hypothetical protein
VVISFFSLVFSLLLLFLTSFCSFAIPLLFLLLSLVVLFCVSRLGDKCLDTSFSPYSIESVDIVENVCYCLKSSSHSLARDKKVTNPSSLLSMMLLLSLDPSLYA